MQYAMTSKKYGTQACDPLWYEAWSQSKHLGNRFKTLRNEWGEEGIRLICDYARRADKPIGAIMKIVQKGSAAYAKVAPYIRRKLAEIKQAAGAVLSMAEKVAIGEYKKNPPADVRGVLSSKSNKPTSVNDELKRLGFNRADRRAMARVKV